MCVCMCVCTVSRRYIFNSSILPVTAKACGVVRTVDTFPSLRVTPVSTSVTPTWTTAWEAIEALLTFITGATIGIGTTQTLSGGDITEVITGSGCVTGTCCVINKQ